MMTSRRVYFSTRDLLMMAALAALGGVTGTYVNALGDAVQSVLGFAGTTQWAAGLHVLWLILAVGLTGKQGAGTITGVLKGAVELLTGNTHGLLVVLVDVVAGLLVDIGLLPFKRRDSLPAYAVAGGLAAASNVFVFQVFAALPADVLAYGALLLVGAVAFASGALFGGVLGSVLLNTLRRSGVVRDRAPQPMDRRVYSAFLLAAVVIVAGLFVYLRGALRGPSSVTIGGAVAAPYTFPDEHGDIALITAEAALRGVPTRYEGYPLAELIGRAEPAPEADKLLIHASDGYGFFISMAELRDNASLLLVPQGSGDDASYNVVGPASSKAWVRGVVGFTVIGATALPIAGRIETPGVYDPADWVEVLDSTMLDFGTGESRYQGAVLADVLAAHGLDPEAESVGLHTVAGETITLPLDEVLADGDIRLFTVITGETVTFAVARMNGEILAADVISLDVL
ncbi:MAG: ECF transporter S component [Anaerolineae bacterium]|nr:ECF transporter S component [Anaerolineae bacterium]